VVRFRSEPDRCARYTQVQRIVEHLDRLEHQAAEKLRQQTEIANKTPPPPPGHDRLTVARKSPSLLDRTASLSSALKALVLGSDRSIRDRGSADPTPLLPISRGTDSSLKPSRSAGGRLDICADQGLSVVGHTFPTAASEEALSRTYSCGDSARRMQPAGNLTRSARSIPTLQVQVQVSDV